MTKRRVLVVVAVGLALAGVSPLAVSWVLTECALRKVMSQPVVDLTSEEWKRVSGYVEGSLWHRPLGLPISDRREHDLAVAAVLRAETDGGGRLIHLLGLKWFLEGSFHLLPLFVGTALEQKRPNADEMLYALSHTAPEMQRSRLEDHIDVPSVLSSGDNDVVVPCLLALDLWALYQHRGICMQVLRDPRFPSGAKCMLLNRIVAAGTGFEWFWGEDRTLQLLEDSRDDDLRASVRKIREQVRARESDGGNAESAPGQSR